MAVSKVPRRRLKKILIVLISGVIVIGVGVAGYFMYENYQEEQARIERERLEEEWRQEEIQFQQNESDEAVKKVEHGDIDPETVGLAVSAAMEAGNPRAAVDALLKAQEQGMKFDFTTHLVLAGLYDDLNETSQRDKSLAEARRTAETTDDSELRQKLLIDVESTAERFRT